LLPVHRAERQTVKTAKKSVKRVATTPRAARTSRNGDPIDEFLAGFRAVRIKEFAAQLDAVGEGDLVVVGFDKIEMAALNLAARRKKQGDVAAYIRSWLDGGIENDLDSLAHDLKKGRAA
jgi:hypothetical protein